MTALPPANESSSLLHYAQEIGSNTRAYATESIDSFVDLTDASTLFSNTNHIQLEFTYWYMKKRQWGRLQRNTLTNEKPSFSILWFLFYVAWYVGYLLLQILYFSRGVGYYLEFILMGFIACTLGALTPRYGWFVRFMFLEVYGTLTIFFVENLYYQSDNYITLAAGFCAATVLTFMCFFVYPYLLRCYLSCSGALTMKLDKNLVKGELNRYVIKQKKCFGEPQMSVYEGQLKNGKPHGIGTWMDTSYQGELLTGWWEYGHPVGPFESMENDTRSLLVNLRIIFATNGGGKQWLDRTPLAMGTAGVECCVSGNFHKGYPKVQMIKGPDECICANRSVCSCVRNMLQNKYYLHIDDEKSLKSVVVSVDRKNGGLDVSGHKPRQNRQKAVTIQLEEDANHNTRLVVDSKWLSSEQREGLLFLHGYDHNLTDSLKRFGQFLALGHFPKFVIPFVFNWPSATNGLMYWCAHSVASDNDTHRDLKRFLQSLKNAGIRQLHVMCHSMGTRFFLRAFPVIKKVFAKRFSLSPSPSAADLAQVEASHLPQPRENLDPLRDSLDDAERKINVANLILLNPDYEIETFKNDFDELRHYCSRISIYADHRDAAIRIAFKMTQKASLGNNILPILDRKGRLLDIDVIDTGDLDSNMSDRHHSFFNVNRLMVDDLYDLIVTGKRAEERTTRLKSTGKVFRFTILPSSVVMV